MQTMMREAAISFPLLGDWSIDPPASFELFGHTFYFYGLIIALGFLLAILYCAWRAPRFGMTGDNLYDLALWIIPFAIIGARIYFVAFQWDSFKTDLISILYVWEGGLAIYGGIIAGVVTAALWCRAKKIPFGAATDLSSFGLLIGQAIGRWGNFMNREAFGAETDIFCRMGLTMPGAETIYVHPTFIYESLWNVIGFILLSQFVKRGRRKYDGEVFILYVLWYGLGRLWVEGLRTDSLYIGATGIRVSQLLAGVSALIAALLLLRNKIVDHRPMYAEGQTPSRPEGETNTENTTGGNNNV